MANIQHLQMYSGEDWTPTLYARDSSNAPVSLTGKTVTWYMGRSPLRPDNSTAIVTKTGTVVSAAAGTFAVTLAAADTLDLNGDYEHMAITTVTATGLVAVVVQGRFRINSSLVA